MYKSTISLFDISFMAKPTENRIGGLMGKPGAFDYKDALIIEDDNENNMAVKRLFGHDAILKHLKSELSIIVDAEDIYKQQRGSYSFIKGKAVLVNGNYEFNGKIEVTCRVACGKLYKLKDYLKGGKVNIIDHLDLLLPTFQSIGLFTFQNGIQNSPYDFENMGNKIIEKLPECPLCMGFYNQTNGIIHGIKEDIERFWNEWELNTYSVMIIRQMVFTLAKILSSIKSHTVFCTHIAHSEAGLIANEVLTSQNYSLFKDYLGIDNFLQKHLITLTYGAVAPIPDIVHFAINTYSKDDIVMSQYAKKYLDKLPKPAVNEDKALMERARRQIQSHPNSSKTQSVESIYTHLKSETDKLYISQYPYTCKKNGYTLTIIESEVPKKNQPYIERDHAFDGATYQNALLDNIDNLRKDFGIHDCR